jgi:hypothetical protein
MSEQNFFDNVFDDPDEDPLLGGSSPSEERSSESSGDPGAPSWMNADGKSDSWAERAEDDSRIREIVVDHRTDSRQDLREINRAVRQGWDVVHLSLRDSNTVNSSDRPARQFVAVLKQEGPQSLFDF